MKIIGHRGAKGLASENTLASFAKALEYNVDEIECDVRITKDNVAVLEHDNNLHTAIGEDYEVSEHTLAELIKYKPDLPTLEQAIAFVNKQVVLQIEVKPNEKIEPVVACVESFIAKGWPTEMFIISSRDYGVLKAAKVMAPHIPLSVIETWSSVRATWRARRLKTKRISMNEHVMWPLFIKSMSRGGYLLCGYTMDDPVRGRKWARYGLHAVITDYPDRFTKPHNK
ncbi:glycerophosphodiester phosphodiesterase [soil metagenome]